LSENGPKGYELRTYAFIDSMCPQYAAFLGSELEGDVPLAGMAELFIELAPGSGVYSLLDSALKQTNVKPGMQTVEREFGLVELHSSSVEDVQEAGAEILSACGLAAKDSLRPRIVSSTVINKVTPHQAQLINKYRKGSLLVPSESLYILEVEPAAFITLAANEAEKASEMKLIHLNPIGRFGRLFLSGTESEIYMASEAAEGAIKQVQQ
jgi:hypothetical protein